MTDLSPAVSGPSQEPAANPWPADAALTDAAAIDRCLALPDETEREAYLADAVRALRVERDRLQEQIAEIVRRADAVQSEPFQLGGPTPSMRTTARYVSEPARAALAAVEVTPEPNYARMDDLTAAAANSNPCHETGDPLDPSMRCEYAPGMHRHRPVEVTPKEPNRG